MGKTRDVFKKIRDAKETFHEKMGMVMDLTEEEDINKGWQEYTEELPKKKKSLMTQIPRWCDHSTRARDSGA